MKRPALRFFARALRPGVDLAKCLDEGSAGLRAEHVDGLELVAALQELADFLAVLEAVAGLVGDRGGGLGARGVGRDAGLHLEDDFGRVGRGRRAGGDLGFRRRGALDDAAAELDEQEAQRNRDFEEGFDLTLIGRRNLRSNNSWMHNSRRLTKGADRCTAMVHPDDAGSRGLDDGAVVRVISRVGEIEVPLEISEDMRPGVVSVPHGYGHGRREGVGWKHAASLPGASVNDITDPAVRDAVTGNAAFNNVAVRIEAA